MGKNKKRSKQSAGKPTGAGRKKQSKRQLSRKANTQHVYEAAEEKEMDMSRFDPASLESYEYELPSDMEDEEIDEDQAFNEEDYEMYGDIGNTKKPSQEDLDDEGDDIPAGEGMDLSEMLGDTGDGSEDNSDDDAKHDRLLGAVANVDGKGGRRKRKGKMFKLGGIEEVSEDMNEGEFKLAPATNGEQSSNKVSLADLVAPMQQEQGYSSLKKQLSSLNKDKASRVEATPLHDIEQEQIIRKVAFNETKKELDKWNNVVKQNREAKTLSFLKALPARVQVSNASLAANFKPSNDLESDLDRIISQFGLSEEQNIKSGESELMARTLSIEDVEKRQAELKRMRSLMFYHDIKRKHMKKIKSKSYRKVRKKLKEKSKLSIEALREIDPDLARQEEIKRQTQYARERMTLKHKNMSKWVKRNLRRGVNALKDDPNTRKAIAAQLKLGQELRKKIRSADSGSDSSDEDGNEIEEDSDTDTSDEERQEAARARNQARRARRLELLEQEVEDGPTASEAKKGVFAMKFMQRAMDKQKQQAKDALAELRRQEARAQAQAEASSEEDEESSGEESDSSEGPAEENGAQGQQPVKLLSNSMQTANVGHGRGRKAVVPEAITVDVKRRVKTAPMFKVEDFDESPTPAAQLAKPTQNKKQTKAKQKAKQKGSTKTQSKAQPNTQQNETALAVTAAPENSQKAEDAEGEGEENPWAKPTRKKTRHNESDVTLAVEQVMVAGKKSHENFDLLGNSTTQEELVRQSFASAGDEEKEFEAQKDKAVAEGLPKVEAKPILPGWGAWGGEGIKPKKRRISTKELKRVKRQRAEYRKGRGDTHLKHVIINERKDKKVAKYMVTDVPHPFTSREQYERFLRNPLGSEWNTLSTHKQMIIPDVITRQGTIIEPIKYNDALAQTKEAKTARNKKRKHKK